MSKNSRIIVTKNDITNMNDSKVVCKKDFLIYFSFDRVVFVNDNEKVVFVE